jgi:phage FluMu protein gp41
MVSVTVKPVDEGEVLTLEIEVRTVVVAMPNDSMDELLLNRAISSVGNVEGILTVVTIPSGASDLLGLLIDGKESAVQVLVMACVNVEEFVLVLLSDTEVQ